jgi:uncharacterized membrane protein
MKKYAILMSLVPVILLGVAAYSASSDTIAETKIKITVGEHVLASTFDNTCCGARSDRKITFG